MQVLRTPDERFGGLADWPFAPNYLQIADADGTPLRLHYVDEGPRDGPPVLLMHGEPSWAYLYRKIIPGLVAKGYRAIAPDLIGFGRSDKPVDEAWHRFEHHRQILLEFVDRLQLRDTMLVCQDWGGLLGLTLPPALPHAFTRLLVMNTTLGAGTVTEGFRQWRAYSNSQPDLPVGRLLARGKPDMTSAEAAAYDAPFPDATYKAALRAFPNLVPDGADAPGAAISRAAAAWWKDEWRGDSFMAIGMQDPVLGPSAMKVLRAQIRGCPEPMDVAEGGHFVQEWGGPIARAALAHFKLG